MQRIRLKRKSLGTIVIAGGGPTGVEVAGMLAEMRKNILEKDYPELASGQSKNLPRGRRTCLIISYEQNCTDNILTILW